MFNKIEEAKLHNDKEEFRPKLQENHISGNGIHGFGTVQKVGQVTIKKSITKKICKSEELFEEEKKVDEMPAAPKISW